VTINSEKPGSKTDLKPAGGDLTWLMFGGLG
jgi:hypothetical protein